MNIERVYLSAVSARLFMQRRGKFARDFCCSIPCSLLYYIVVTLLRVELSSKWICLAKFMGDKII